MNNPLKVIMFLVFVVIIAFVIFDNVVRPSDYGKNLSTFFCGKNMQYSLTDTTIEYNGTICSVILKKIEPYSRLYFLENGDSLSSAVEFLPNNEVHISNDCIFSKNITPQQFLVTDENLSVYICFNP